MLVHYDPSQIPLPVLIAIHLHTHAATKAHAFRSKYRSAIYVLEEKFPQIQALIDVNEADFVKPIITGDLRFVAFQKHRKLSE